jgi:hypothetical protein
VRSFIDLDGLIGRVPGRLVTRLGAIDFGPGLDSGIPHTRNKCTPPVTRAIGGWHSCSERGAGDRADSPLRFSETFVFSKPHGDRPEHVRSAQPGASALAVRKPQGSRPRPSHMHPQVGGMCPIRSIPCAGRNRLPSHRR